MNKKASIDNIYVMAQIFGFAIFLVVVLVAWNYMTSADISEQFWDLNPTSANVKADAQRGFNQLDNLFILVYVGYHLGILGLSYFLRSHPIWLFATLMFMIIATMVASPLSNAFVTTMTEPEFITAIASFPKMLYIMANLPKLEMVWIFITGIVMVGLSRE